MFGNSKPFGAASTFGGGTFGATSTPFGQSNTTFGAKPPANNVFGTTAFGAAAPAAGGLFGTAAPTTGTGLFGQTSTAFGQPASTSGGSFGFGATSTPGGLFGTTTQPAQSSGLFGGSSTSAFGSPRPTFGGFGGTSTSAGLFGQNTATNTGLFGTSTGFTAPATNGTTVKFNPPTGTDTMMKGGTSTNISTRHQCITCMKEYENKSLEELRMEDYAANRKGPQAGMSGFGAPAPQTGLFGAPAAASTSAFSFGTTQAKPLFGSTGATNTFGTATGTGLFGQTSQPQSTGIFGKPVGFGAPTTSAAPSFNFGAATGTSLFGQTNQQKPLFGQPTAGTGLFGTTATTQPSTGFGTSTGFGGFGTATQPTTGLFGAKPTGFGTTNTTTTSSFNFGNPTMSGGGLFGQKPATSAFGATTGFGAPSTGFGSFGTTQTASTGLFGQAKPATTGFGTAGTVFGPGIGGLGTSSFTNFGQANTGTNLFGGALANKAPGFNFGGTGTTGFGFGQPNIGGSSFNFGPGTAVGMGNDPNAAILVQQQLQTQQVLAFTASPFGDNPLFRNSIKDSKRREELLKPTNPAAQKALLTNNQYKVSPLPAVKMKPKPITPIPNGKVSLFDGLEDEEPSLGNATFVPKRSIKKLVLKHHGNSSSSFTVTSNISAGSNRSTEINFSTSILLEKTPSKESSTQLSNSPLATPLTVEISDRIPIRSEPEPTGNRLGSTSPLQDSLYIAKSVSDQYVNLKTSSSSSLNDTFEALHTRSSKQTGRALGACSESDSRISERDLSQISIDSVLSGEGDKEVESDTCVSLHPTGIVLERPGYYTCPSLDEIISLLDEKQDCFVENFTVGREGYGKVCFPGITNVAKLNLDEIVHFRRKEITIYPDDANKPPIGEGLNRKAEVTLDCVWPTDKTTHSPIKDPERLSRMGYREKIEKSTARLGATFIDYRPETGSWVFQVRHFSKYGLEDSDDECDDPKLILDVKTKAKAITQPKKAQLTNGQAPLPATSINQVPLQKKLRASATDDDDEMQDINQSDTNKQDGMEDSDLDENFYSPIQQLVISGVNAERIQGMKASFFHNEQEDIWAMPNEVEMQDTLSNFSQLKASDTYERSFSSKQTILMSDTSQNGFLKKQYANIEKPSTPVRVANQGPMSQSGKQHMKQSSSITSVRTEILSSFPVIPARSLPRQGQAIVQTSISGVSRKIPLRPFTQSLTYQKQNQLADIGYFMGRRFRPGWGPNWTVLHLGRTEITSEQDRRTKESSVFGVITSSSRDPVQEPNPLSVSIAEVQVSPNMPDNNDIQKHLVESLEVQLEHSASTIEDGAPIFVPKPGIESFHAHSNLSQKHLLERGPDHSDSAFVKQCNQVWELCVALWGEIPGLEADQTVSSYTEQMARREALSKWLIKTTKENIQSEINDNSFSPKSYLLTIFSHLSGRQIFDAVQLAQDFRDHGMATLLAQAEGNSSVRRLICKQLINWEQCEAYKLIKYERLKLYTLLAGVLVWSTSSTTVNCCENLDWKRSLALHLWYHCSPTSSVQDAVTEYEKAFQGTDSSDSYAQPPYPPYIENDHENDMIIDSSESQHKRKTPLFDTCYHLLKLYCDRSHRLDKLLMPGSSTPAHLDHRLSWLLYQSLLAHGYNNLPMHVTGALNCNFSAQLEAMDMWHWAVFVMLHIADTERRTKCVKELLLRHLTLSRSEQSLEREEFLQEKLLVPKEWIFEAKAIKARTLGQHADEAWYLLKAGFWNKSHNIIITHLASDAIINENYEYLLRFLNELAPSDRSCTILDWTSGGKVFMDYIHVSQMVNSVVKGDVSAYDVEKLQPEVMQLSYRLSSIKCLTAKDRLCQSEMAKKTATLLRAVLTLQAAKSGTTAQIFSLAPYIKNLPMPEDYAFQELRAMARNYLLAVTSEDK